MPPQVIETRVRDATIESVVVYQDRAEVKRAIPVHLCAGENEVVVCDLAECIDKNSIRVEGKGNAVITDVIYSSKTTSEETQSSPGSKEEYNRLKEEMVVCRREIQYLEFREQVLIKEKALLAKFADHISKIHSIKGEYDGLSQLVDQNNVTAVIDFFEKYEEKISDLDDRIQVINKEKDQLKSQLNVLTESADKVNPQKKAVSTETVRSVRIGLEAPTETDAELVVSYVVSNASWSSAYDVRVFTKDKAMKVQYYGLIKQQTGEDWEDAKISLSTAQPSVGGSAPDLPTRLIRFQRPKPRPMYHSYLRAPVAQSFAKASAKKKSAGMNFLSLGGFGDGGGGLDLESYAEDGLFDEDASSDEDDMRLSRESASLKQMSRGPPGSNKVPPPPPAPIDVTVAKVSAGLFNTTYAIPRTTTIPADNTEHKVTVALIDLSPVFHYTSVPRLSPYSFLQAKAKNNSPYTMLAGPANIFLDNNFIAKSELSDVSPNEEFTISLGADQSIRITCQPVGVVHNTRSGLLSSSKTNYITYTHIFQVKNTKADQVNVQVSEQVPLSTDERIKVTVIEPDVKKPKVRYPLPFGYAVLNESNNVEWHAEVDASAELKLKLVYTVEHPAQDGVSGLPN